MSILSELNSLLDALGIPIETGVFSGVPPDEYLVITPMTDTFEVFADNQPQAETQEVRLSLFIKVVFIYKGKLHCPKKRNSEHIASSRLYHYRQAVYRP